MAIPIIRRIRVLSDVPQWRIAQETGIHPSRLSKIENERVKARPDELELIAEALQVQASELASAIGATRVHQNIKTT